MAYKEMYFVSDSYGNLTVHPEVLSITQNSNNTRIKLCGNFTDEALVWATIIQADGKTLPRRAVMLTTETIEIGGVEYRVYSYRLVQDDTKTCPSATGVLKISFSIEESGEEILTTNEYSLTIMRSNISAVTNTPADTIDAVATKVNQNTADIAELESGMASIDLEFNKKVDKTTTIAGVDLQDDITDTELLEALGLDDVVTSTGLSDGVQEAKEYADNNFVNLTPDGETPLINSSTSTIDTKYIGAGVKRLAGQWNASTNTPMLPSTPTEDMWGNVYDVTFPGTQFGIPFNVGDQIVGYKSLNDNTFYWGKTDNTDLVTSVQGRTGAITLTPSDIKPITDTYFSTSGAAAISANLNGIVTRGFYTAYGTATGVPDSNYSWFIIHQNSNVSPFTPSATQRAVAYSTRLITYERIKQGGTWQTWRNTSPFIWETGTVTANAFTADCSANTNYILTNSQDIALTISNSYNGAHFLIEVHGAGLTLPGLCKTDAAFDYVWADTNEYYQYEFVYNGTVWRVTRNVYKTT